MASGFIIPSQMKIKPGLEQLVDAQANQRLSFDFSIGKEEDSSRMSVNGMVLDLIKDNADYEHVPMPGKNGPHPNLSSGIRRLNLVKEGSFISMKGTELVQAIKSCWELVWRKDSPAGALLFGFEVPEDYKRNDITLPQGQVYLSFPVWTTDGLRYARSEKERILKKADEYLNEKNEELEKCQAENNLFKKALHYRNAYAAAENYYNQPVKRMQEVPDKDEVLTLQDDLFLTTKGLVWAKNLPNGKQTLLGTVNVSPVLAEA